MSAIRSLVSFIRIPRFSLRTPAAKMVLKFEAGSHSPNVLMIPHSQAAIIAPSPASIRLSNEREEALDAVGNPVKVAECLLVVDFTTTVTRRRIEDD